MITRGILKKQNYRRLLGKIKEQHAWLRCPCCGEITSWSSSKVAGDQRYCLLCAGTEIDRIVLLAYQAASTAMLKWGAGKDAHALHVVNKPHAGTWSIGITCTCDGEGTAILTCTNFSRFWDSFSSFVEQHFTAIKAIIERIDQE